MNSIVITSIFEPTEAVRKFSQIDKGSMYVVGDKKSPTDWFCPNVEFISVKMQEESDFFLKESLPYNHYCRKMLGYLWAMRDGATTIVETDDDNIPYDTWQFLPFEGSFKTTKEDEGFINIYQYYTDQKIWPRGLPLRNINDDNSWIKDVAEKEVKIGIWQGLADEDPDVDAIYRLTDGRPCFFEKKESIVLGKNTLTPFNTQNTFIRKELFPLMYLPTYVTFRYTDILRGLIAQPIMWSHDYLLGITSATVIQKRNQHDFYKDFLSEIPMYETTEKVIDLVSRVASSRFSISDNLHNAYESLLNANIVEKAELININAWLKDLENITR
ncbi:STELLO glycosyltransferase family protein [Bacteroidales bacterium OttesenSCG-928-A17]|nr:STELLO glycosyltransferase family protein [Bacteroidales bacterium OttesenSCG-928-A17]